MIESERFEKLGSDELAEWREHPVTQVLFHALAAHRVKVAEAALGAMQAGALPVVPSALAGQAKAIDDVLKLMKTKGADRE